MDTDLPPLSPLETEPAAEPTRKPRLISLRWLYLLPAAFALGLALGYLIFALPLQGKLAAAQKALASAQNTTDPTQNKQIRRYDVPDDGDPSLGSKDAAITIIEFSDFECPFCRSWQTEVWPKLKDKYGDKIRLVYRDFPLFGLHANAAPSAEAAECANEQGQFWPYHDQLLSGKYQLGRPAFDQIAQDLKLDMKKFASCVDERRYQKEVEADYQFASNLGISSTPTFFVNGLALVGAQPFEVFDQVIDLELKGQIPKN